MKSTTPTSPHGSQDYQAAQYRAANTPRCTWTLDEPEWDTWATGCGELFVITCSTPSQHKMKFCPYCGKPLQEAA